MPNVLEHFGRDGKRTIPNCAVLLCYHPGCSVRYPIGRNCCAVHPDWPTPLVTRDSRKYHSHEQAQSRRLQTQSSAHAYCGGSGVYTLLASLARDAHADIFHAAGFLVVTALRGNSFLLPVTRQQRYKPVPVLSLEQQVQQGV